MAGINKVFLLGTVVSPLYVEYTLRGNAITRCKVETSSKIVDQRGKEWNKKERHSVVAYGRLAELWRDYWPKGSILYIEGRLQSRFRDAALPNRAVEVVVRLVKLVGKRETKPVAAMPKNEGLFLNDGYPWQQPRR